MVFCSNIKLALSEHLISFYDNGRSLGPILVRAITFIDFPNQMVLKRLIPTPIVEDNSQLLFSNKPPHHSKHRISHLLTRSTMASNQCIISKFNSYFNNSQYHSQCCYVIMAMPYCILYKSKSRDKFNSIILIKIPQLYFINNEASYLRS